MASSDLNKVMLIGRLGGDPESRPMPSGEQACNFSLATSDKWKDKKTGEQQERTEWHRISVFGGLAKICAEYLRKGSKVYLEGQLRTRKWTDKQGQERYTTEINCFEMKMLESKSAAGGEGGAARASSRPTGPQPGPSADEKFEDDIPF